jgi:[ribosomal protein S5]-alanine N-acetyltransferase
MHEMRFTRDGYNFLPMTPAIETPRLILQALSLADAPVLQPLFARWEIVAYLNDKVPWPYPDDGVEGYYRDVALPAVERGEEWHWTLRLKLNPGRPIGCIGLFLASDNNRGFWLSTEFQGQGLMTEAVIAVNDYWFDVLGQPVLRVSEKTGMRLVATGESYFVSGQLPSETWEITAEEWRAIRPSLVHR